MGIDLRLFWRLLKTRDSQSALNSYVTSAPHPQNSLDIFKEQWASRLPEPFSTLKAGSAVLFEDERIKWAEAELGGFKDKTILDLGPLEGGHPHMFERSGAAEIVSIEGNPRNFLKCLVTKELLGLKRVSYQCGDFIEYLKTNQRKFDIVNASGVLYHQRNPAEFLALLAKASDRIIIWTHYYDEELVAANPLLASRFSATVTQEHDGFKYQSRRQDYKNAVYLPWFCGGSASHSHWMTRKDILRSLNHIGFNDVRIAFEEPRHPNGPCFNLVGLRS